jgi:hypothetical protein
MPHSLEKPGVFDREFLGIRAKMIELAAALDRVDREEGPPADDPRREKIRRGLQVLAGGAVVKAEEIQLIFSLPYEEKWR